MMVHGSLFSGIGGFDLAAEWMGWQNAFHCEIDPFCNRVLNYYWPNAKSYKNIDETDFTPWFGKIDILSGGFPCQPFSTAGLQLGTADARHKWPQNFRAVQEIRPRWYVGENVRGLVSWNDGMVFEQVCADLEAEGYKVQPFLLPAAGVKAPHRRQRIWFIAYHADTRIESVRSKRENSIYGPELVAYTSSIGQRPDNEFGEDRRTTEKDERETHGQEWNEANRQRLWSDVRGIDAKRTTPYTAGELEREQTNEVNPFTESGQTWAQFSSGNCGAFANTAALRRFQSERIAKTGFSDKTDWQQFPTQPPILTGDDGLPTKMDGITFSDWRRESIKAAGNAIVPQVAFEIFKAIETYEMLYT